MIDYGDGAGAKTLDGAGTDALIINWRITCLSILPLVKDFPQHGNGSDIYTVLTDSASNTISLGILR